MDIPLCTLINVYISTFRSHRREVNDFSLWLKACKSKATAFDKFRGGAHTLNALTSPIMSHDTISHVCNFCNFNNDCYYIYNTVRQ